MPLYIDVHTISGGVPIDDVARAHAADVATQPEHVQHLRYWVNEELGKVFCLVQAPSANAATAVHAQAHGLLADEIFQVREGL